MHAVVPLLDHMAESVGRVLGAESRPLAAALLAADRRALPPGAFEMCLGVYADAPRAVRRAAPGGAPSAARVRHAPAHSDDTLPLLSTDAPSLLDDAPSSRSGDALSSRRTSSARARTHTPPWSSDADSRVSWATPREPSSPLQRI